MIAYDAIIEDTMHCQVCGLSILCGGNDTLIVEVAQSEDLIAQGVFCLGCAQVIHDEYRKACAETGVEP